MTTELAILQPAQQSLAMQIMLDDKLYGRTKEIAAYMARADGFTPAHLIGKTEACFAVVLRALTWKLDPYAVAQSTYQTPGKKVGFEGKLCQAILENSGRLEGGIEYTHFGDWTKVQGKFIIAKSAKDNDYPKANWQPADEEGLGVKVSAKIKGEAKPREFEFLLKQAYPRNSTLWALDPKTQICYLAIRRFASVVTPGLFMGLPFDREEEVFAPMKDITPKSEDLQKGFMDLKEPSAVDKPKNKLEEILSPNKTEAKTTVIIEEKEVVGIELQMPEGEIKTFPEQIDTIELMQTIQDMMPPDQSDFIKNNRDALSKVALLMRADKPKAAEQIEKMIK